MSDLVVKENVESVEIVPNFSEVDKILTKSSKLTSNDLIKICKYYNLTPIQLFRKIRDTLEDEHKNHRDSGDNRDSGKCNNTIDSSNIEYKGERIVVYLPQDEKDKPKPKVVSPKRKSPKKTPKPVSFTKIKSIVGKKNITKDDLRILSRHYKTRIKDGIGGIWFSAAQKGHLFILKKLNNINKHIKDTNLTDKNGKTAQQIAESNNRGHVSKWLARQSTQHINIGPDTSYYFKQTHSSDSEESDQSISN
jgi:hypothetical protein